MFVGSDGVERGFEFGEGEHKGFRDVLAAEPAEPSA